MNTLTILLCMGLTGMIALLYGVLLGIAYRKRHEPAELGRLRFLLEDAQRKAQEREVEVWRVIGQRHREVIAMFVGRS